MSEKKPLFDGVELGKGETFTKETLDELTNGKGEDEE